MPSGSSTKGLFFFACDINVRLLNLKCRNLYIKSVARRANIIPKQPTCSPAASARSQRNLSVRASSDEAGGGMSIDWLEP